MRILLFTHKPPYPDLDGGTRAMRSMLEGLLNQGHEVWIVTFSTPKHPYQPEHWPPELLEKTVVTPLTIDTSITRWGVFANLFSSSSYILSRFYNPALELVILDVVEEWKPEVIQMEGLQPLLYQGAIRRIRQIPIVYRAHNVEHLIWQKMAAQVGGLKKWYLNLQTKRLTRSEKNLTRQADAILPIAEGDAKLIQGWTEKPMLTLPYGLEEDWFEEPLPSLAKGQFFHIGAMDWPPNQEAVDWLAGEIWPAFLEQHPEAQLHLAGRSLEPAIQGGQVINHGTVDDVRAFMRNHGVLLVPLKSGSGLRIKILEAMALGVPVLTTPTGLEGIPAVAGETVLLADSAQDWQKQMQWCLDHPEDLVALGEKARQWVRQHYGQTALMQQWTRFVEGEVLS